MLPDTLLDIRSDIDLKVVACLLISALWSKKYTIGPKEAIMEHSKKKIAIMITFRWRSESFWFSHVESSMVAANESLYGGLDTAFYVHQELSLQM